ncbi:unnamed protein product [Cochlearia groenlandica]
MARYGVNKKKLVISFLKKLCILLTIPILFLSNVLRTTELFNKKAKPCLDDDGEEEGLIEISLVRDLVEDWMSTEEYHHYDEEMIMMMERCEEEEEENMIEIDISTRSIV